MSQRAIDVDEILPPTVKSISMDIRVIFLSAHEHVIEKIRTGFEKYVESMINDQETYKTAHKKYKRDIASITNEHVVECIKKDETQSNNLLRDKIADFAQTRGFIVKTNKSAILPGKVPGYSRFYSSKPDLSMFKPNSHCGFAIIERERNESNEEESGPFTLTASASENTKTSEETLPQLLGNMEKVAGDIVHHHMQHCARKLFDILKIYGFIINYEEEFCNVYMLEMNFVEKRSYLSQGSQALKLDDGIGRLISELDSGHE